MYYVEEPPPEPSPLHGVYKALKVLLLLLVAGIALGTGWVFASRALASAKAAPAAKSAAEAPAPEAPAPAASAPAALADPAPAPAPAAKPGKAAPAAQVAAPAPVPTPPAPAPAAAPAKGTETASFTGVGRLRIPSRDRKPAAIVVNLAFPYDPKDSAFSEELAAHVKDFKKLTSSYFSAYPIDKLKAIPESAMKNELTTRFNSVLRLGQIKEVFFTELMIMD